jgi:hypothetical protein
VTSCDRRRKSNAPLAIWTRKYGDQLVDVVAQISAICVNRTGSEAHRQYPVLAENAQALGFT